MTSDPETLAVYDAEAARYADLVDELPDDPTLSRFLNAVKPGGRILDLGAGPGQCAAAMQAAGFEVEAWDPSASMMSLLSDIPGVTARQAGFSDLSVSDQYDGIWANFSLLHAKRTDLPGHLAAIARALVPGGIFHIAVKVGRGEARDRLGRFYTFYSDEELTGLLDAAGLTPLGTMTGEGVGLSGDISPWIAILARG